MFHHAQCTSLASSGSKKKLVRVTNQIYLISLMCRIKNRLIKSKNSIVDGAFDPFFKWFKNHICQVSKKQLWKLIHIHDGTCENLFKKYYDLQAVQKKSWSNNKKIDPLLLTYLFLFVYVSYESTLLLNSVECVVYAFVYVQNIFDFFCTVEILFFSKVHQKTFQPSHRLGSKMVCCKRTKFGNTKNYTTGGTIIH